MIELEKKKQACLAESGNTTTSSSDDQENDLLGNMVSMFIQELKSHKESLDLNGVSHGHEILGISSRMICNLISSSFSKEKDLITGLESTAVNHLPLLLNKALVDQKTVL